MPDKLKIEYRKTDSLIPYARNPRKNDPNVSRMAGLIQEFGFRIPVLVKSDGSVIDGHLRIKAAQKLGMEELPCVIADGMTDAQVKAFRIAANKSVEWSEWDNELLAEEFASLRSEGFDLLLTGFDFGEEKEECDIMAKIISEEEYEIARDTAENAGEIIKEKLAQLAEECPDKINSALGVVLPSNGGDTVFILVDPGIKDTISELKRYADAGERSPLECLLKSVYRMNLI